MRSFTSGFATLVATIFLLVTPAQALTDEEGTARFDRTSLVIDNMDESLIFWRDVMQFELLFGPTELPRAENEYLGWTDQAVVRFARFKSPDGAGIGLLEVTQDGFGDLEIEQNPTGHGGVILVLVATNIDALHSRALSAGAVLKPLAISSTGRSKQMYLKSPSGHVLEIYELLPKTE